MMLDALIRSVKELMDQKTTRERVGQIKKSIGIALIINILMITEMILINILRVLMTAS